LFSFICLSLGGKEDVVVGKEKEGTELAPESTGKKGSDRTVAPSTKNNFQRNAL